MFFMKTTLFFCFYDLCVLFADKNCLIPAAYTEKPRILSATNSSFSLELPPCRPQLHCQGVSVPTPTYLLHYGNLEDGNSSFSCSQGLQCTVLVMFLIVCFGFHYSSHLLFNPYAPSLLTTVKKQGCVR